MAIEPPNVLTSAEREVVDTLGTAWNQFLALERLHADELAEFRHGIHRLQHLVMARPAQRRFNHEDNPTTWEHPR